MNIYVVRHGQTDYNVKRLFQGQTDVPLNRTGEKQAKEMAEKFKNVKVDNILVSPLLRARQTASYISNIKKIKPLIEEDLKERSFGKMEGQANREECNIEMLLDFEKNYEIYDVEPIQSFFKRVGECLKQIIKKYDGQDIVLVTHACVTQAIEYYFHGMPEDKNIEALALKNCEIRKYEI